MRRASLLAAAAAAALASAQAASAHAFLIRTEPAAGTSVRTAPARVLLVYDEAVSPAHITVERTDGASAVAGKPFVPKGHANEIVVPLRPGLAHGGYVVHWSEVDEDDGHLLSGRFGFAIGAGVAAPAVKETSGGDLRAGDALARWLLLSGLLVAGGVAVFRRVVWRLPERDTAFAGACAAALAAAAAGAAILLALQPGTLTTRFDRVTLGGAVAAGLVGLFALASIRLRPMRALADGGAVLLLALPTLDGHAVAPGPSHALSVPADLVHVLAASVWVGGVFALVLLVPRELVATATRRFAPLAAGAVAALALTGVLRAVGELRGVSQLWTTSYGNTILAKTAVFAAIVGFAALARRRPGRRQLVAEGIAMCGLVAAVALLVGLRPGRDVRALAAPAPARPPAFVTAGAAGTYAVGVALSPAGPGVRARATVLAQDGPARGLDVTLAVSGKQFRAAPCGPGCYGALASVARPSSLAVQLKRGGRVVGRASLRVPERWPAPSAAAIVRRATNGFRRLRSLVVVSTLAAAPGNGTTTLWKMQAPDRLDGRELGTGAGAVIIGHRRWDRDSAREPWVESPQTPLHQPSPPWPPGFEDAHVVGSTVLHGRRLAVVSFLDPVTPSWFAIDVDPATGRTYAMDMIATAHFMHEDYRGFDAPLTIRPPR